MRARRLAPIVLSVLFLAACTDRALDPEYPVAVVSTDDGLVGTWRYEAPKAHGANVITLTIKPARVPVVDGRLCPSSDEEHPAPSAEVYRITLDAENEPPVRIVLNAYRLTINGHDYLAGQISFDQLCRSGLLPFVAPLHVVLRVQRDGDTLRLWGNEPAILWIPGAVPLDPPADPAAPPPLPQKGDDYIAVVATSIDRVIELLRRPDADELFRAPPVELRRVRP